MMKQEVKNKFTILRLSPNNIPMAQAIALLPRHHYRETYRVPCYPVFPKDY